jgi:hypothetical protein
MVGRQRRGNAFHQLGGEAVILVPHHLECGEIAPEPLARKLQEGANLVEACERAQRHLLLGRRRENPQRRARDNAERALGADEQLLQVDAGVVLDVFAHAFEDLAVGEHGLEPEHEIAGHAIADHAIAAGIGRDVAADGAAAARAEIEREHESVVADTFLQSLQRHAGLGDHDPAAGVDLLDRGHALRRQHDFACQRHGGTHEARHAALRGHGHARLVAEPQEGRDILGAARPHHRQRWIDRNARHIGVITRVDLVAGEDRRRIERRAKLVDDGGSHR